MKHAFLRSFFLFFLIVIALPVQAEPIQPLEGAPKLYSLTPTTAVTTEQIWFSAKVSDNEPMEECNFFVDEKLVKKMTIQSDVITTFYTFPKNGSYDVSVECTDTDDNVATGKTISVNATSGSAYANPGDLIKMGCPAVVYPNHPCTAVYYFGVDGKRHAFPNEPVFKSWFKDFDDLIILSEKALSQISLGKNVTYRPGERLIKFSTTTVYAVSYTGMLRPIANGEIASSIYGEDWVSLIQGVDDVFFGNYRIGTMIESTNDFSWKTAYSQTNSIDKTF